MLTRMALVTLLVCHVGQSLIKHVVDSMTAYLTRWSNAEIDCVDEDRERQTERRPEGRLNCR